MELDKIYNANCYKKIKEIPDNSIDCIYTDIPYLIKRGGDKSSDICQCYAKLRKDLEHFEIKLQNNTDPSKHNLIRIDKYNAKKRADIASICDGINYQILDDFCRVMKKINIFVWCNIMQIPYLIYYFLEKGCYYNILVWAKENSLPSNNSFLPDLEYCLHFREPGVKLTGEYELKHKWFCSAVNKKDKEKWFHPTIKPLEFVMNHIKLATKPNDVVLDTFAGSGTTGVACEILGRHYILIEINKDFYQIAVDRVKNKVDCKGQYSMFTV